MLIERFIEFELRGPGRIYSPKLVIFRTKKISKENKTSSELF